MRKIVGVAEIGKAWGIAERMQRKKNTKPVRPIDEAYKNSQNLPLAFNKNVYPESWLFLLEKAKFIFPTINYVSVLGKKPDLSHREMVLEVMKLIIESLEQVHDYVKYARTIPSKDKRLLDEIMQKVFRIKKKILDEDEWQRDVRALHSNLWNFYENTDNEVNDFYSEARETINLMKEENFFDFTVNLYDPESQKLKAKEINHSNIQEIEEIIKMLETWDEWWKAAIIQLPEKLLIDWEKEFSHLLHNKNVLFEALKKYVGQIPTYLIEQEKTNKNDCYYSSLNKFRKAISEQEIQSFYKLINNSSKALFENKIEVQQFIFDLFKGSLDSNNLLGINTRKNINNLVNLFSLVYRQGKINIEELKSCFDHNFENKFLAFLTDSKTNAVELSNNNVYEKIMPILSQCLSSEFLLRYYQKLPDGFFNKKFQLVLANWKENSLGLQTLAKNEEITKQFEEVKKQFVGPFINQFQFTIAKPE